ncbi:MAG: hypothetical protein C0621_02290 [Desulfuromonas sp.]|nr:MAG: hypothetical protein C0621_02290 [Desulfuromonas sp.]
MASVAHQRLSWQRVIVLTALLSILLPALAVARKTLTFEKCWELACQNHPALQLSQLDVEVAKSQLESQRSSRNLALTFKGESGYFTGQGIGASALITSLNNGTPQIASRGEYFNGKISAELPLYSQGAFWGMPTLQEKAAAWGVTAAEFDAAQSKTQLRQNLSAAYADLLLKQSSLSFKEEIATAAALSLQQAKGNYRAERISLYDLENATQQHEQAQQDLFRAQQATAQGRSLLALVTGLPDDLTWDLAEPSVVAPLPPDTSFILDTLTNDPRLKAQRARIEAAKRDLDLIRSKRLPELTLTSDYGLGGDYGESFNEQFTATLKMQLPLIDFGHLDHQVREARQQLATEEARYNSMALTIQSEQLELYYTLSDLERQQRQLDGKITLARKGQHQKEVEADQSLATMIDVAQAKAAVAALQLEWEQIYYSRVALSQQLLSTPPTEP